MIRMVMILLLSGWIEHVSTIQCYTCNVVNFHCSLPLSFDGGDESNENDIVTFNYDSDYACMSDHSFNPRTREKKINLGGIKDCQEIDIPNHRVHCCYTNICNKELPDMITRNLADMMQDETLGESKSERYISSMSLITFSMIFSYLY